MSDDNPASGGCCSVWILVIAAGLLLFLAVASTYVEALLMGG